MVRIYLPGTLATLGHLREQQAVPDTTPAAYPAYAVTPALREGYAVADQEELEYAAFTHAARAALALLAAAPEIPRRRVVISADVPETQLAPVPAVPGQGPRPGPEPASQGSVLDSPALVRLRAAVPLPAVAALHLDGAAAEAAVAAAVAALPGFGRGDPEAEFMLTEAEDHELEWYDVSELDQLPVELGG